MTCFNKDVSTEVNKILLLLTLLNSTVQAYFSIKQRLVGMYTK